MIDISKIFNLHGLFKSTDIMELLSVLVNPDVPMCEKKVIWNMWKDSFYSQDELIIFFYDSLFNPSEFNYVDVFAHTENYHEFYELAMAMDLANIDSRAYYLFWILNYGHGIYTKLVKDAYDYDPDVIKGLFPCIEELVFE